MGTLKVTYCYIYIEFELMSYENDYSIHVC